MENLKYEVYERATDFNGNYIIDTVSGEYTYILVATFTDKGYAEVFCNSIYANESDYEIV